MATDWIQEKLNIERPDVSPPCDFGNDPPLFILSMREHLPINNRLELSANEMVHTFAFSPTAGTYAGELVDPGAIETTIQKLASSVLKLAFLGEFAIVDTITFGILDPETARFDPALTSDGSTSEKGILLGKKPGTTHEFAQINVIKVCTGTPLPSVNVQYLNPEAPLGVFGITTNALAKGQVGTAYSAMVQAVGGTPPYTWSATGLPPSLTINSTNATDATIAGTPMAGGTFSVVLNVLDSSGINAQTTVPLNIEQVESITVDLDASFVANYVSATAVVISLEPGTYDVEPIGIAQGGYWDSWARIFGFESSYELTAPSLGEPPFSTSGILGHNYWDGHFYQTAIEALSHAVHATFTLTTAANVKFSLNRNPGDPAQGGMSLRITRVP